MLLRLLVIFTLLCLVGAALLASQGLWRWALTIGVPAAVALLLGLFHRLGVAAVQQARRDAKAGVVRAPVLWYGD